MRKYIAPKYQRQLFFEGNSLLDLGSADSALTTNYGGEYVPNQVYAGLAGNKLAMFSFAISGQTGTEILAAAPTKIMTMLRPNDMVFYMEGTNDMFVNGLSGAAAFVKFTDWLALTSARTSKICVGTVTARDHTGDRADLMDDIAAYNVLVRANTSLGYTVCDLGADAKFDTRADCSDTNNYFDKLHITKTARDSTMIPMIITSLTALL